MSSYFKYYNLLLFQSDQVTVIVVGEDLGASMTINEALIGKDATEVSAYEAVVGAIEKLTVQYTGLTRLPPGDLFVSLKSMDISNCMRVTEIPGNYAPGLLSISAASTKLSSIPVVYNALTYIDCSNCKRIASISIATLETVLMSHSGVTELTNTAALVRLIALNSKVTDISLAPNLVVVMWSASSSMGDAKLTIHPECTKLVHTITSGNVSAVNPPAHGVLTSIQL